MMHKKQKLNEKSLQREKVDSKEAMDPGSSLEDEIGSPTSVKEGETTHPRSQGHPL
ncbi:hypothetical protein QG37_08028 [Candidozyma auris]|nr:hypothetical protein QG37_08028 [[Candida] auris]